MYWRYLTLLICLASGFGGTGQCQAAPRPPEQEYLVKAVFLEKIARQAEWPQEAGLEDPNNPFVLTIFGDNVFGPHLDTVYHHGVFLNHPLKIKYVSNLKEIGSPQILFITASARKMLPQILKEIKGKPVLTIGDSRGFMEKGVIVNLINRDSNISFEINQLAAQEAHLKFSYRILNLASKVVKK